MRGVAVAAVAGLLGALAAQERRPAFVVAMDVQGRPVAGAAITCFASPTVFEAADDVDVVEGTTDERGRIVAKLLAHRRYSAFAILPGDEGRFLASETQEDVAAGAETVVRVVVERRPQRVVIEGLEAWQHLAPLAIAIAPEAQNRLLLPVKDGQVPRLPSIGCVVVRDAMGQELWSMPLQSYAQWRKPGEPLEQLKETVTIKMPPPQDLVVRVSDSDGRPVANAELRQPIEVGDRWTMEYGFGVLPRPAWRRLGCTGDDGSVKVQLAVCVYGGKVMEGLFVQARAAGRAHGVGEVLHGTFDGRRQAATQDGVLRITLAPVQRLRVQPPGAYAVTVLGRAAVVLTRRGSEEGPVFVHTDALGIAELPLMKDPGALRVAQLQRGKEPPIWSIVATDGIDSWVNGAPRDVRVLATDAAGNPARGQQIVMIPWLPRGTGFELPMLLDQAGRTTLRVGPGTWFLWCCNGSDAAWRVVDVDQQDIDVALPMQPIPRASVRIVDAEGKPRIGFFMPFGPCFESGASNWSVEERFLIERHLALSRFSMRQNTTDAAGCLHYLLLPLPKVSWRFDGPAQGGAAAQRGPSIEPGKTTDFVVK